MKTLNISNFKVLQTKAETEVLWQELTTPVRKPVLSTKAKLIRKACKEMVARDKRVNRIARQIAWGVKTKARNMIQDAATGNHKAHVTAWWAHLVATKGQGYVDNLVLVRKAKRQHP